MKTEEIQLFTGFQRAMLEIEEKKVMALNRIADSLEKLIEQEHLA